MRFIGLVLLYVRNGDGGISLVGRTESNLVLNSVGRGADYGALLGYGSTRGERE